MIEIEQYWELLNSRGSIATLALIVLLFIVRWILLRFVRKQDESTEISENWQRVVKRSVVFALLIGLVLIWAPQLRTFALSLTAVAVALVIATKELILCLSGSVVKASGRLFSVGDLIQVGTLKGYVSSQNLLTTNLREVNESTEYSSGNQAIIPNSLFLIMPVKNFSYLRPYLVHTFVLYAEPKLANQVATLRESINNKLATLEASTREERDYQQLPKRKRYFLEDCKNSLRISTTDLGVIGFVISFISHENDSLAEEAEITRLFFQQMSELKNHF